MFPYSIVKARAKKIYFTLKRMWALWCCKWNNNKRHIAEGNDKTNGVYAAWYVEESGNANSLFWFLNWFIKSSLWITISYIVAYYYRLLCPTSTTNISVLISFDIKWTFLLVWVLIFKYWNIKPWGQNERKRWVSHFPQGNGRLQIISTHFLRNNVSPVAVNSSFQIEPLEPVRLT